MNDEPSRTTLRQILVAADASPTSLVAVDMACDLAARHEASVAVLFVDESATSGFSGLPDLVEIRRIGASSAPLTAADLRRQYRARARRLHHAIDLIQRRIDISCRLEVTEGRVGPAIIEAMQNADLVLMGRTGAAQRARRYVGSTARKVITEAQRPLLIVQKEPVAGHPIVVLYHDSPTGRRALRLAALLAEAQPDTPLNVLTHAADPKALSVLREELARLHPAIKQRLQVRRLTPMENYSLHEVIFREEPGMLVLPHDNELARRGPVEEYLAYVDHPVLLVR